MTYALNSNRKTRHARAYRLSLEERLNETNHEIVMTTTKLLHTPTDTRIHKRLQRKTARSARLQALLNATNHHP